MKSVKNDLPETLEKVAFAVSGGADSMFMCISLIPEMKARGTEVEVLIVDHGLRIGSYEEAVWVKQYLQNKFNYIKVEILNADINKNSTSNIQAIARKARYKALLSYCKKKGICDLFIAHNLDDQAETIFMRIERGSGLDGVCGMKKLVIWDDVRIHRPILNVARSSIEVALSDAGWKWVDDPSNMDEKYSRVRVRKFLRIYPEYAMLIKRFGLLAENLQRTYDFVTQDVSRETSKCIRFDKLGFVEIDLNYFNKLHEELRLRIITNAINYVSFGYLKQRLESTLALLESIKFDKRIVVDGRFENSREALSESHAKFEAATLGGCEIVKKKGVLYIFKELKRKFGKEKDYFTSIDKEESFDGRFKVLSKCKERGYVVKHLGFEGYKWLRNKVNLPKVVSNKIYQSLPVVYDCDEAKPIAVYGLYGDWELYIEPLFLKN